MKKRILTLISFAMAACLTLQSLTVVKAAEKTLLTQTDLDAALHEEGVTQNPDRASVHDPSIVTTTDKDGQTLYYVFGTHMAVAKSYDLTNWEQVYNGYKKDCPLFGTLNEEGETEPAAFDVAFENSAFQGTVPTRINDVSAETDFGSYNAKSWHTALGNYSVAGNLWAPDVIFNEKTGKWHMYMSLNGSRQNSVIVLLTADEIEGPYVYQGPVVYSGFSNDVAALSYKNSDLELVYGELDALPEKYDKADDGSWGNYWPHAIDPCVYYDEDGNLRMTYGSWSGGIFEIQLDENTGLRDYTVTYEDIQNGQNISSDKYFGKHLAGGYYVSGEASYVKFINDRYYLFVTNGDLAADGNYQMRVFSSKNPDGPFLDTNGQSAVYDAFKINFNANYGHIYSGSDNGAPGSTAGARLMTNYKWDFMEAGEVSQGHNSVLVNEDGAFVIYHTRFDNGIDGHQLRVHQLYTVGDGALVAAPCEYDALLEDKTSYTVEETEGSYDVIWGKYDTNPHWVGGKKDEGGSLVYPGSLDCETPEQVELTPEGKVTLGDTPIGSWALANDGKYATVTINDSIGDEHLIGTYDCIFIEQNAGGKQTTCFTGMNAKSGISIWGCSNQISDARAIALTSQSIGKDIPNRISSNLKLPTTGISGTTISWTSNAPEIIADNGVIDRVTEDTKVTLTATISRGNAYFTRKYPVIVAGQDISMGNMTAKLPSADFVCELDNPFYAKNLDQLYIHYTITLDEASKKDGLAGLFRFYGSRTGENGKTDYVALQSAPYLKYQSKSGDSMEINKPSADHPADITAGQPITCEILIDRTSNSIRMTKNGKEISLEENSSTQESITAGSLLDTISKSCDKFSWGSPEGTEVCTLENVIITDTAPVKQSFSEDSYRITPSSAPAAMDNAFAGEDISLAELEYTVTYTDTTVDSYGGLFAFYQTGTSGRISFHTMPYICYNDGSTNWMDIKTTTAPDTITGSTTCTYKYIITKDKMRLYVNDKRVFTSENSSGADYEDLLYYLSRCDKLSIGVNTATSFWYANSKITAEISGLNFTINSVSKVYPPYASIQEENNDNNGNNNNNNPDNGNTATGDNNNSNTDNNTNNNGGSNTNNNTDNNTNNNGGDNGNTETDSLKVSVKKVTLKSVKNQKGKKMLVTWKKVSDASGYTIQYSTVKQFKKAKTLKVKKGKTTSTVIKKLKKGQKYYVKIRAFKTVKGKTYYGKYSNVKQVTIKK